MLERRFQELQDQFHTYVPRFLTNPWMANKLSQDAEKYPMLPSPPAPWTRALKISSGEPSSQIIAHRGYRSKYPENSILAFEQALKSGAQALETDIHLSKDNIPVLSHDPSLKRCYGLDKLVKDCEWAELEKLRSLAPPHESLPRLTDLLEYLTQPELEDVWVLLDIKMDDDPDLMMRCIAKALESVSPSGKPWTKRIVLGIWSLKYLTPCGEHLPEYALSNIGFSTIYAKRFTTPKTPNVGFNMFHLTLMMPISGPRFIADAHTSGRTVLAWTVNDAAVMKWMLSHQVDGIITDDIDKAVKVKAAFEAGDREGHIRIRSWIFIMWIWMTSQLLGVVVTRRLNKRYNKAQERRR